jgi:hypothetical protein
MWIIFGTAVKTTRIAGGARVDRDCEQCGERATFYEKEITSSFRLYFVDIFDYRRHRVMSCGSCGACYATDELGAPTGERTLGEDVGRAAQRVGGYLERAAGAVETRLGTLFAGDRAARTEDEPETHDELEQRDPPPHDEAPRPRVRIKID